MFQIQTNSLRKGMEESFEWNFSWNIDWGEIHFVGLTLEI